MKFDMKIRKISKEETAKMSRQAIIDKARECAKAMGFEYSLDLIRGYRPRIRK